MMIKTEHLILEPIRPEQIEAFLKNSQALQKNICVTIPESWPWSETEEILPWVKQSLEEDPQLLGWLAWFIIHRKDSILIGDAGFAGKPDHQGCIDIGYSIIPEYRQKGFGYEAARALVRWAFSYPQVKSIHAETLLDGEASIRILRKLGMVKVNTTSESIHWVISREEHTRLYGG